MSIDTPAFNNADDTIRDGEIPDLMKATDGFIGSPERKPYDTIPVIRAISPKDHTPTPPSSNSVAMQLHNLVQTFSSNNLTAAEAYIDLTDNTGAAEIVTMYHILGQIRLNPNGLETLLSTLNTAQQVILGKVLDIIDSTDLDQVQLVETCIVYIMSDKTNTLNDHLSALGARIHKQDHAHFQSAMDTLFIDGPTFFLMAVALTKYDHCNPDNKHLSSEEMLENLETNCKYLFGIIDQQTHLAEDVKEQAKEGVRRLYEPHQPSRPKPNNDETESPTITTPTLIQTALGENTPEQVEFWTSALEASGVETVEGRADLSYAAESLLTTILNKHPFDLNEIDKNWLLENKGANFRGVLLFTILLLHQNPKFKSLTTNDINAAFNELVPEITDNNTNRTACSNIVNYAFPIEQPQETPKEAAATSPEEPTPNPTPADLVDAALGESPKQTTKFWTTDLEGSAIETPRGRARLTKIAETLLIAILIEESLKLNKEDQTWLLENDGVNFRAMILFTKLSSQKPEFKTLTEGDINAAFNKLITKITKSDLEKVLLLGIISDTFPLKKQQTPYEAPELEPHNDESAIIHMPTVDPNEGMPETGVTDAQRAYRKAKAEARTLASHPETKAPAVALAAAIAIAVAYAMSPTKAPAVAYTPTAPIINIYPSPEEATTMRNFAATKAVKPAEGHAQYIIANALAIADKVDTVPATIGSTAYEVAKNNCPEGTDLTKAATLTSRYTFDTDHMGNYPINENDTTELFHIRCPQSTSPNNQ